MKMGASVSPNKEEAAKKVRVEPVSAQANMGKQDGVDIGGTLEKVLKNIAEMRQEFNGRIDKLEEGLAEKIRGVVQEEVGKVRTELQDQIDSIKRDLEGVQQEVNHAGNTTNNVVIFGIPETANENLVNKVNAVIREGVKEEVEVESANRKKGKENGKAGIVIATFKNRTDKDKVMANKKKLSKSKNHKNVGIDHERTPEELLYRANLRVLSDAVGKDKVVIKGRKVIPAAKQGKRT